MSSKGAECNTERKKRSCNRRPVHYFLLYQEMRQPRLLTES
jgi:hypothetical protein